MATSTASLTTINVFPTEALYNSNKGSIGAAEISLVKDTGRQVIETYVNGTLWYRKWSDGWIEQGGLVTNKDNGLNIYSLLQPFADTNYTILGQKNSNGVWTSNDVDLYMPDSSKTTTNFGTYTNGGMCVTWYACGMGA